MENGKLISDDGLINNGEPLVCNDSFMRHVGYTESTDCIRRLYNPKNIKNMSKTITNLLTGVDPQNRPIIVPDSTICSVISDIYDSYRLQQEIFLVVILSQQIITLIVMYRKL